MSDVIIDKLFKCALKHYCAYIMESSDKHLWENWIKLANCWQDSGYLGQWQHRSAFAE